MNIQLTQHQAAVLQVVVNREIQQAREALQHTDNPAVRNMISESIDEKQRITQALDQAMTNVVLGIDATGHTTVTEVPAP